MTPKTTKHYYKKLKETQINGKGPFDKERTVFSTNGSGKTGYPRAKKMKLDIYLTTIHKN